MGDPNASIPTPQPVHYRPMFGAFGRAPCASAVTFVSAGRARRRASHERLGLQRELCAVREHPRRHRQGGDDPQRRHARRSRSTPRPTRSAPTASCSPASPRPCCRWRSAISCSELLSPVPAGRAGLGTPCRIDHSLRDKTRRCAASRPRPRSASGRSCATASWTAPTFAASTRSRPTSPISPASTPADRRGRQRPALGEPRRRATPTSSGRAGAAPVAVDVLSRPGRGRSGDHGCAAASNCATQRRRGAALPRATALATTAPRRHRTLAYDDRHRRRLRLTTEHGRPSCSTCPKPGPARRRPPRPRRRPPGPGPRRTRSRPRHQRRRRPGPGPHRLAPRQPPHADPDPARRLRIRADHVLEHLLTDHLGATVTHATAPFDPEGGAYGHGGHEH